MTKSDDEIRILPDEPEDEPTAEFNRYAEIISDIIKSSKPNFSVGVYGDWGTGKTTLLKNIKKKIDDEQDSKNQKIITIWFNAWRYEREDQFALVALMKTIAYGISGYKKYKTLFEKIKHGSQIVSVSAGEKILEDSLLTSNGIKKLENLITKKIDLLDALTQSTIYYDGLRNIENELSKITKDDESRIIVFIDDIDRCSPKKALEVLESIKVFLGMEGFVYVVGLSHQTLIKLISSAYFQNDISGENYIKKIIQIPIHLPVWIKQDLENLIDTQLSDKLKKHSKFIQENKSIISSCIELNPRELKQFINNLILTIEVFFGKDIERQKINKVDLLLAEAIKHRWYYLYLRYSVDEDFRKIINTLPRIKFPKDGNDLEQSKKIIKFPLEVSKDIKKQLEPVYSNLVQISESDRSLLLLNLNESFWNFLKIPGILPKLDKLDWKYYRKVTETIKKIPTLDNTQITPENLFTEYLS